MNIKTIKKIANHNQLISSGYKLTQIMKGYFKKNGIELMTPVLEYRKSRYVNNVDVGYYIKYYNRFGLIHNEKI